MKIRVTAQGSKLVVKPESFLGGDLFQLYKAATRAAGCRFDASLKADLVAAQALPLVHAELVKAGFEVVADQATLSALHAKASAQEARHASSAGRLEAIKSALAARGLKLLDYQPDGIQALLDNPSWGLFDEPGLGKTAQALLALPAGARALVVCPASLKYNWQDEAKLWRPDLAASVLDGLGSFRYPEPGELAILNYDILPGKIETNEAKNRRKVVDVPEAPEGVQLIADEAHALKSSKANRSARFRHLSEQIRLAGGGVWVLTGTEMPNRPPELWSLLVAAGLEKQAWPGGFPQFQADFNCHRDSFVRKDTGRKVSIIVWGERSERVPQALRRVSIKRMKRDVLPSLPPKTYTTIRVDVDRATAKLVDGLAAQLAAQGIDINDVSQVVKLTKSTGATFELFSKAMSALATAKIPAALEIVESYEDQGEPLAVFSAYRAVVDLLAEREGWARISGSETPEQRMDVARRLQAGELKGVAGTIRAMGVGLTLHKACTVLRVDRDFVPANNSQAADRVHRIGQVRGVQIIDLVANHKLDARCAEILIEKETLIQSTTEAAAVTSYTRPAMPADASTGTATQFVSAIDRLRASMEAAVAAAKNGSGGTPKRTGAAFVSASEDPPF